MPSEAQEEFRALARSEADVQVERVRDQICECEKKLTAARQAILDQKQIDVAPFRNSRCRLREEDLQLADRLFAG